MARRALTQEPENTHYSETPKGIKIALIVLVITVIIMGVVMYYQPEQDEIKIIRDRFIDINGDGLVDYIRYAEVIINNGETNFTLSPSQ